MFHLGEKTHLIHEIIPRNTEILLENYQSISRLVVMELTNGSSTNTKLSA
jgi:hypothetical protein